MLAFWIENWFLCSFFAANLTINSSSLLVVIFVCYHCLLTGVTILGKPRWQEISSEILDTGIVCDVYINCRNIHSKERNKYSSRKGILPFRVKIKEFHSHSLRRTKHIILRFLCFLGILWYSLIHLWLLLIKEWLLLFPNKLNFI